MGDIGSFIGFHRIGDLMEYELSCPQKYDDKMLRTVCCYHPIAAAKRYLASPSFQKPGRMLDADLLAVIEL